MTISTTIAKINKKYGAGTIVSGKQLVAKPIPRCTTGSLSYDLALGGGWPLNQWHEVVGDESSGKTVIALKTIAANQALDKKYVALWVAAESLPMDWAERLGVDLSRFIVHDTNIMEEACDAVLVFLDSRDIDCIVIDSLPALMPSTEDDQMMEEFAVGAHARLTGKFFRKAGKNTKRSLIDTERPVLGIMINQWRSKIGVTYGDPRTTPGGLGKNYFYFTRTESRRTEWLETAEPKVRIGQRIGTRIIKNKSAPGQRVGEFDFYFAPGGPVDVGQYDTLSEVINLGLATGAIDRRGRYYEFLGTRIADGREALFAAVREDAELADNVRALVLNGEVPMKKAPAKKQKKKTGVRVKRG